MDCHRTVGVDFLQASGIEMKRKRTRKKKNVLGNTDEKTEDDVVGTQAFIKTLCIEKCTFCLYL